ncbi:23S rRNA (adenine(2030)-N(6))-methyltransferase RlmJ [Acetobacter thailandicus]|uniref:23S rRNA (adenine(2030)-N(6))-methyltransferase RlmJ n=1 Tax=Acetobacter thailandicus TaxID=1502842 RepID=UPI001BAA4BA9|nr:23S rRNA (adenine(2030)-N(6))-methyltransferase RlmJ [Acetobacter thailandicus]MBS1002422.1 23S rRNA (adenine(2030)-N(6))-methyltransferase RlmJ [Acetobacter thailandicus]
MNYRHAYHAGNFADCMKHALLVSLLSHFLRKPAPFMVLDTHAGLGRYDLLSTEAEKTQEWHSGIGLLADEPHDSPLTPWLEQVKKTRNPHVYPGSPLLISYLLREQDRLICCEKHPDDKRKLYGVFARNPAVAVHERDGYEALRALLPPKDIKRGLVLIDPPFEELNEFARLAQAVSTIQARFPAAIITIWYPIKHRTPVRNFMTGLQDAGVRDILTAELLMKPATDPGQLNGSGLMVIKPPYGFAEQASQQLTRLKTVFHAFSAEVVQSVAQ